MIVKPPGLDMIVKPPGLVECNAALGKNFPVVMPQFSGPFDVTILHFFLVFFNRCKVVFPLIFLTGKPGPKSCKTYHSCPLHSLSRNYINSGLVSQYILQ